jgi:phage tail P2-like protein
MSDQVQLLPSNSTALEKALDLLPARVDGADVAVESLWSAQDCDASILPWLAWALSVDVWDVSWGEATKRKVVAASADVHRRKGTVGAVRRALDALGYDIEVTEWFEYGGDPHTFRVAVDLIGSHSAGVEIGPAIVSEISGSIENVKPVRSHFDVALVASLKAPVYVGAFAQTVIFAEALPDIPPAPVLWASSGSAVVLTTHIRSEIGG